jgi:hypothetical protein
MTTTRHVPNRHGKAKLLAVIGLGVGAVLASAFVFAWVSGAKVTPTKTLDLGMQFAQRGDHAAAAKSFMAVDSEELASDEDRSKFHLLKGIEYFEQGHAASLKETQYAQLEKSLIELEQTSKFGMPSGYEGLGGYYLGSALHGLRKFKESLPHLAVAIDRYPKKRFEAIEKAIDAQLQLPEIDQAAIKNQVERWKKYPTLRAGDIDRGQIALATMHQRLGDNSTAKELASSIAIDSPVWPLAELMLADMQLREAMNMAIQPDGTIAYDDDINSQLDSIIDRLQKVSVHIEASRQTKHRANYVASTALKARNRFEEALTKLNAIRTNAPQTIESFASAVSMIDIYANSKRWKDATQVMRILSLGLGELRWYENDWLPIKSLKESLVSSGKTFLDSHAGKPTIEYCDYLPSFIDIEDKLRLKAPAYVQLIDDNAKPKSAPIDIDTLYHDAAKCYEQLANLQLIAEDFPDLLWKAIDCYARSQDYERSNVLADRYLNVMPRFEQPKALLQKAENQFNADQPEQAILSLNQCVAIAPDHPKTYEARLYAAQILQSLLRDDEAAEQLMANMYDGSLTPNNQTWKTSLFELGFLLCRTGCRDFNRLRSDYELSLSDDEKKKLYDELSLLQNKILDGVRKLEEAVRRYPDETQKFDCVYRIAESYRTAAEWPKLRIESEANAAADLRDSYRRQRDALLQSSRDAYTQLRETLSDKSDLVAKDERLKKLLRNSCLGEADLMYEMHDYEKAVGVYRSTANRFVSQPISLEALTRSAECLEKLGRNAEASRAINQAIDLLDRIDPTNTEAFAESTRGSKEEWTQYLNWLKTTIQ